MEGLALALLILAIGNLVTGTGAAAQTSDGSLQCYECTADHGKGACGSDVNKATAPKKTCRSNEKACVKMTYYSDLSLQWIKRGCAIDCVGTSYDRESLFFKDGTQTKCCWNNLCNSADAMLSSKWTMVALLCSTLYALSCLVLT